MHPIGATTRDWITGRFARDEISVRTYLNYHEHLRWFASYVGPDRDLADITTTDIERWIASLHVQPSTRNTYVATIRVFFAWATERELLARDPTLTIRRAKTPKRPPRRLPADQVAALIAVARGVARPVIILTVQTMIRRSELEQLTVADYDRRDRTLYIHGKGAKDRVVPVPAEARQALDEWLAGRLSGPMWPGRGGAPMSGRHLGRAVTEAGAEAGVPVTLHRLRHTGASDVAAAGHSVAALRDLLGHASLSTTSRYVWPGRAELATTIEGRSYRAAG